MKEESNIQTSQIHVRVNQDTRTQWLEICKTLSGSTQSAVFKKLVSKIHDSITEITNINSYAEAE